MGCQVMIFLILNIVVVVVVVIVVFILLKMPNDRLMAEKFVGL